MRQNNVQMARVGYISGQPHFKASDKSPWRPISQAKYDEFVDLANQMSKLRAG